MKKLFKRKLKKLWKRQKRVIVFSVVVILTVSASSIGVALTSMKKPIDPSAYKPLLNLIARAESNGNYDAYFSNPNNTSVNFTSMSIAEVLRWQSEFVAQGNASSAVGRYQIINTTLSGLVQRLGIDTAQKFDQSMQDRLAVALLEKRGAESYMRGEISKEDFAASLAKEWAGLPKVVGENPEDSYYAGDGLNKAQIGVNEMLSVTDEIKPKS